MILIWRFGESRKDRQINLRHYRSIYTTSMGFSSHRTEICQFKIPPTAFSEQTAKYNVRQYFCLYGIRIVTANHLDNICMHVYIATTNQ